MKDALLDQVMNVLPDADSDGHIWASFYQFFNTKEKRTKVLESITDSERINLIKSNPEYFESALEYIFKKSVEKRKVLPLYCLIIWKGYKKVRHQEIRETLLRLYTKILSDYKILRCMGMVYPHLDEFSYDHQNQIQ
jgi:hypothetical protein